jgi:hypothetical protein
MASAVPGSRYYWHHAPDHAEERRRNAFRVATLGNSKIGAQGRNTRLMVRELSGSQLAPGRTSPPGQKAPHGDRTTPPGLRSYVTNLRKGRIENPGYGKMRAIARAMGFPPALWFEDVPGDGLLTAPKEGQDLAARVESLFQTIVTRARASPTRTRMWPA